MESFEKLYGEILLGNESNLKNLIEQGINLEVCDEYGRTPIFYAIVKGFGEVVELLCESYANINVCDKDGKTPLHFAAIHSRYGIAELLIRFGAVIDAIDTNGNTPLSDAVFYSKGYPDIILLLLKNGADSSLRNVHGVNPRELAESIDNYNLARLFK